MNSKSSYAYGNVREDRHLIYKQIDKLIGAVASRACLGRQVQLIGMLTKLDMLTRLSGGISPEQHLRELEKMRREYERI